MSFVVLGLALVVVSIWVYGHLQTRRRSKGLALPPSPKKSWIPGVGHGLQLLNKEKAFPILVKEAAEECKTDLVTLDSFGNKIILLNTARAVKDLFELRGTIYSSRPHMPLLRNVICRNSNLSFEPYNDTWKRTRKATHRELNINQVKQYQYMQERESYLLMQGFLDYGSSDLFKLTKRFGGSISFGAFYDYRINSYNDPVVEEFVHNFDAKVELLSPGASFYDVLPEFLRPYVPEFLLPSLKKARKVREEGELLDSRMSKMVQDRLSRGESTSSFLAGLLQREAEGQSDLSQYERDTLSGVLVAAAVDTTQASFHVMVMAMITFPEVQLKLQQAVDKAIGRSRLPTTGDIPDMPYVRAFVAEALRWRGVSRIASPHRVDQDDYYNGYFIPKDSTVVMNSWIMEHDPVVFPEPDQVIPERYLKEDGSFNEKVPIHSFGHGRRVCPGAAMASNSLTMAVACFAWAYTVSMARDAAGNFIPPDTRPEAIMDNAIVFGPKPFPFEIARRDPSVEEVIRSTVKAVVA